VTDLATVADEYLYAMHRAGQLSVDQLTAELARRHLANLKRKWAGRVVNAQEVQTLCGQELTEAVQVGAITVGQRGQELERRRVYALRGRQQRHYR
jgi:hypothetical protein